LARETRISFFTFLTFDTGNSVFTDNSLLAFFAFLTTLAPWTLRPDFAGFSNETFWTALSLGAALTGFTFRARLARLSPLTILSRLATKPLWTLRSRESDIAFLARISLFTTLTYITFLTFRANYSC
jgi:hypothetical protein